MPRLPYALLAVLLAVFLAACSDVPVEPGEDSPYVDEFREVGSYRISLARSGPNPDYARTLVGEDVDTNWDESIALVYLNTDDVNEPLGTVTMTIDEILNGDMDVSGWVASLGSIVLSVTDVRSGTGAELNARLYEMEEGERNRIVDLRIGNNFISGTLQATLRFVPPIGGSSTPAHTLNVLGPFVAVDGGGTAGPSQAAPVTADPDPEPGRTRRDQE